MRTLPLGLLGCTGAIADPPGSAPPPESEPPPGPAPEECEAPQPGRSPHRRLTDVQYRNTVRDLFGAVVAEGALERAMAPAPETVVTSGFRTRVDANLTTQSGADGFFDAAERIAQELERGRNLEELAGCDLADRGCAEGFVVDLGRRAFRRPLREDERALLLGVHDEARAGGSAPESAVGRVVELLLQAPQFLYLVEEGEPGAPGEVVPLTGWEVASRLSYLLWGSMPDEALFEAAAAGELATVEGVEREARRLLEDERATEGNDIPIDASGELLMAGSADGPFDGATEMTRRLAESELLRDCMARQLYRHALGRHEEEADACALESVRARAEATDGDLLEMVVAVTSDAFRFRRLPTLDEDER